jgi:hypothetical protein
MVDERQDAVFGEQLLVDEADNVDIDRHRVEVQERHAELLGRGNRDVARRSLAVRYEPAHDLSLALAGVGNRIEHGGFVHQAVEHEPLREARQNRPD